MRDREDALGIALAAALWVAPRFSQHLVEVPGEVEVSASYRL